MKLPHWFSSVESAEVLLKKKLTYVGTMKNKLYEVPHTLSRSNRKHEIAKKWINGLASIFLAIGDSMLIKSSLTELPDVVTK